MSGVNKFNADLLWNMVSFGFVAVLGFSINLFILQVYNAETLGIYNQVYALYILLSQLAVGGVHLAVQRYIPRFITHGVYANYIVLSALSQAFVSSVLVIIPCLLLWKIPGYLLNSKAVSEAFFYVVPGLLFFSLNKVLLSFHNGFQRMKAFAIFQLLRFVLMFLGVVLFYVWQIEAKYLAVTLGLAEFFLFFALALYSLPYLHFQLSKTRFFVWQRIQFRFGMKALLGNILLDVNTRVDVFILGVFLSDAAVGIYSFASTFAEGFQQLPVLLRNNLNPVLTRLHARYNKDLTQRVLRKIVKRSYRLIGLFALVAIAAFPLVFAVFEVEDDPWLIWGVFAILVGFCGLSAGYQPLNMLFNQWGFPGRQTNFIGLVFVSNLLLNLLFVPVFGVLGSALGTGISYLVQVMYQRWSLKKIWQISI
jgi:O-antigen/teichoic acid export membrane protein